MEYILDVYDTYQQELNFGMESDYHGFLSGFLINFRYRAMAEVYVELIMGGGYADVVLLVRGQGNLNNSVPIVIELKAGPENAMQGLEQARDYVRNGPISSIPIYTSSIDAVCVGLNFNPDNAQRLQFGIENFLGQEPSLIEDYLILFKGKFKKM